MRAFDADVDVLALRQGHEVFQHVAKDALHGQRRLRRLGGRLRLGQVQELVEQLAAALYSLAQQRQPLPGQVGHVHICQPFGLQRQCGQRRAQLVRGIGDKAALRFHGLVDTREQAIDGHGKWTHLKRKVLLFDRVQLLIGAQVDFFGEGGNGPEHLAHQVGDDQQQHRHQNEKGQHRAQRPIAGDVIAKTGFLGHGKAFAVRRGCDQHAEGLATDLQRLQAIGQARRERERASCVHAWAGGSVRSQTLDDHACLFVGIREGQAVGRRGRREALPLDELRHLAQNIVLQLMGFIEGGQEGKHPRHEGHHKNGQRQGEGQLELNRRAQAPFETIHPSPLTFLMTVLPSLRRRAWIRYSTALLSTSSPQP